MAESDDALAVREFQQWFENHQSNGDVILFLQEHHALKDGALRMDLLFSDESNITIICPRDYPHGKNLLFDIRTTSERLKKDWLPKIRQFAAENRGQVKLPGLLSKCVEFHRSTAESTSAVGSPPSPPDRDSDFEDGGAIGSSSDGETEDLIFKDDDNFTTQWDIEMDFLKKRWLVKEKEMREKLFAEGKLSSSDFSPPGFPSFKALPSPSSSSTAPKPSSSTESASADTDGPVPKKTKLDEKAVKAGQQIFDHESAAFQILSNEMIMLLQVAKNDTTAGHQCQFSCTAVDDSLYRWRVQMNAFPKDHPLSKELSLLKSKFGYDAIELQLDFVPEYPFYPPLLRLVRPRLKGSLVQSLANIDILKLTFWNPAKSVHDVLKQIKGILLQHARLDVDNERNNAERFPEGAYLPLEDYLIKLALATEVRPRANFDVISVENLDKAPQIRGMVSKEEKKPGGGWRAGTGYGSGTRTGGWNPEAYVVAQQEKDKQILEILKNITVVIDGTVGSYVGQRAEEVRAIIEGSCLLPFLEQQFSVGSFIEIGLHLDLYRLMLDLLEAISKTTYLLPLLCNVSRQKLCVMALLGHLQETAVQYLEYAKDPKESGAKPKQPKLAAAKAQSDDSDAEKKNKEDQELLYAKKIVDLFANLTKILSEAKLTYSKEEQNVDPPAADSKKDENLFQRYIRLLKPLQFSSISLQLTGQWAHKFAKNAEDKLSKEIRTIWKEWTTLRTSLPINLQSSIFVRYDEDHVNLLQALITGPEDTPYANGCFFFDICFPVTYPAKPPMVTLRTTGGGKVRFNPNLYNCGKVCLSLLGTWSGDSGENWNAKTSTLLQVLVSIQSLILVEEPYFNEPGYEKTMGTEDGKRNSERYNKEVRSNCLRYAMLEQLQQPPPGFEEIVRLHYQIKKDAIIKQLDEWSKLDPSLKVDAEKMKKQVNALPAPN